MRKLSLITALSLGALLFVGCEKDEKEVNNLPAVPTVSISDGELGDYENMENAIVTENDLEEFTALMEKAFTMGMGSETATRGTENYDQIDTIKGLHSGHVILDMAFVVEESGNWIKGTSVQKAFDYSDDGNLFLGGAVATALYMDDNKMDMKVKGIYEFAGDFSGEIIYDCLMKIDVVSGDLVPSGSIKIRSGGKTFELMDDVIAGLAM